MTDTEWKVRKGSDGVFEAWYDGRRVRFPADGGRPSVSPGAAPDDAVPPGDDAPVGTVGDRAGIGYGRWVVILGPPETTIFEASSPELGPDDDVRRVYYLHG